MIWIDFDVICIGQEQISIPADMNDIVIEGHQRTADSEPFYDRSYNFDTADRLSGCWYQIWVPEPLCYEESFFDISSGGVPCVEVVPKWSHHAEKVLSFYLKQSPAGRIAVLLRIQDTSDDIVHSPCSLEEFVRMLHEGSVRWNELYYVHS